MNRRGFLRRVAAGSAGAVVVGGVVGGHLTEGKELPRALVAGSLNTVASTVGGATVEAHGSIAARRLVEDGARDPDVLALADPRLFEGLTDRVTCFATNALVVAFDPESEAAATLKHDWHAVRDRAVTVGRTDPAIDPLGYRTVMALRLSSLDAPTVLSESTIFPEVGLLQTLQSGKVDAVFAYRNMAVEAGVPYVDLPPAINFADPARGSHYAQATVELPDRTVSGAPIQYGVHGITERGKTWVRRLVSATETLRTAGFSVPQRYPRTRRFDSL